MKKSSKIWIFGIIVALILIVGAFWVLSFSSPESQNHVYIDGNTLNVEIADTEASREQGLSDRSSLGENNGMLFVFDRPDRYGFWMKDMEFPLDMIWIDQNDTIVDITPEISTSTYPEAFYPQRPAEYVLEVNSGYASVHNIKIGDKIIIKKKS